MSVPFHSWPYLINCSVKASSKSRSVRQRRVIREQSILLDTLCGRHWRCMKQKTYTMKLTIINMMMFRMKPCDIIPHEQDTSPKAPECLQQGVPSLDALYLGRCQRTLWPVHHHENRKKTSVQWHHITSIVLPVELTRWNASNSARDPVWDHLKRVT